MIGAVSDAFEGRSDEAGRYSNLRPDLIVRLNAAPPSLVVDGALTAPWQDGAIEAAPFTGDPNFARFHMENVPAILCLDMAVILINQQDVIGLYIDGQQVAMEQQSLGEYLDQIAPQCGDQPVSIDVIVS